MDEHEGKTMPGRLFLTEGLEEIAQFFGADPGALAPQPPRLNVAPGQDLVVVAPGPCLTLMRWGLIPVGRVNARGRPVMETIINARSETVFDKSAFAGTGRAIVPCNGWYEWIGEKRRKTAWKIAPRAGGLLAFAAISDTWTGPGGITVEQVATVTCAPNATIAPIHHRMGVILPRENWAAWLSGDDVPMDPAVDDLLYVEEASGVDWDGS